MLIDDQPRPSALSATRPVTAWAVLLGLLAVAALAWWAQTPPVPGQASDDRGFDTSRAAADLAVLAARPAPAGSAESDAVRDLLVTRLRDLGLAPEVRGGVGITGRGQAVVVGRAENVVATLRGTTSTGTVVVAAHYDTVAASPGAADDQASVASVLEIARLLSVGPPPRNDVTFLLTDAEEPGLLGAAVYVGERPGPGVVVNGEGPGNAGPSIPVQLTPGAAGIVAGYAADVPHPAGDSVTPALYPLLPGATDLDQFAAGGYLGVTVGPADGRSAYHSPLDTPDRLDPATLQHHGETMLALVRGLAERDVAGLRTGADASFVALFGLVALHWSDGWLVSLVLLSFVVVMVFALVTGRVRGPQGPGLVAGSVLALLGLLVAAAAGAGLVAVATALQPAWATMSNGEPSRPGLLRAAVAVLAVTVVVVWAGSLHRRVDRVGIAFGTVLWLAVLGAVLAGLAPGAAFAATVPAITVGLGGIAAVVAGPRRPRVQLAAWAAGGLPAVVLLVLQGTGTMAGGLPGASLAVPLYVAAGLLVLPVVAAAVGRRTRIVPAVALLATAGLVAAAAATDTVDAAHPRPTGLAYVTDSGSGAYWVSTDPTPPDWTRGYAPEPGAIATPLPGGPTTWRGPAPAVALPAPEVTVTGTRPGPGGTVVALRVRSLRAADTVTVQADRPVTAVTVTMDGEAPVSTPVEPATGPAPDPRFPFVLKLSDPTPTGGATIELTVADPAGMLLAVSDTTDGLDGVPGFIPRPPDLVRSSRADSDVVVVSRLVPVP